METALRSDVFGTLEDPREGPLRAVMVWGYTGTWAFPGEVTFGAYASVAQVRGAPDQHPLALEDGRMLPVESIGPPIDVVSVCRAARALGPEPRSRHDLTQDEWREFEEQSATRDRCRFPAIAQLALLGEVDLANAMMHRPPLAFTPLDMALGRRASAEHMLRDALATFLVGDDCLARTIVARVHRAWMAFQAEPQSAAVCGMTDCAIDAYAQRLMIGLDRRLLAPRTRTPIATLTGGDLSPERAQELADAIEDVAVTQYRGSSHWEFHPLNYSLMRAGDSAIPALIALLERPDRLTRSPIFTRRGDLFDVLTVHDFARKLLDEMLEMESPPTVDAPVSMLAAAPLEAAAYRARFAQVRGMSPAERCLFVLRQTADTAAWAAASGHLVDGPRRLYADHERRRVGDPVGATTSSNVAQLLSVRANEALRLASPQDACSIASSAIDWDPRAAATWLPQFERSCARTLECECGDLAAQAREAATPQDPE